MKEILEDLALYIKQKEEKRIQGYKIERSELTLIINHQDLIALLTFLRQDIQCEFVSLIDIAGVDYPHRVKRFDLVYHLLSPRQNQRIRIKVPIEEDELVPSLTAIYPGAIWFEREAYDLYGILFSGHPDLRRLLTDYGFEGHPLRKDFPVTGFVEVRYDDEARRVVYDPVELRQEFRNFDSMSPWEGINHAIGSSQGVDKNEKNVS